MIKTALVLSGGGAAGAFQVGVLKNIWRQEKAYISAAYGTSVGALNATALKYIDFDALENIWLGIRSSRDVLRVNPLFYIGLATGKYKTGPLKNLIEKVLENPPMNSFEVFASAVNLRTSRVHYFGDKQAQFQDMVLASASVPFHMEPVGDWVDGGVRDHTPIRAAILDGYKRIIVICTNPFSFTQSDEFTTPSWPKAISVGLRAIDILQHEILLNDLRSANGVDVSFYAPEKRIIDTFEYDSKKIRAAIAQGASTSPTNLMPD